MGKSSKNNVYQINPPGVSPEDVINNFQEGLIRGEATGVIFDSVSRRLKLTYEGTEHEEGFTRDNGTSRAQQATAD